MNSNGFACWFPYSGTPIPASRSSPGKPFFIWKMRPEIRLSLWSVYWSAGDKPALSQYGTE